MTACWVTDNINFLTFTQPASWLIESLNWNVRLCICVFVRLPPCQVPPKYRSLNLILHILNLFYHYNFIIVWLLLLSNPGQGLLCKQRCKGWELTFLFRTFGLSQKNSKGVGFWFSDKGLKSQNLRLRTKKSWCFLYWFMISALVLVYFLHIWHTISFNIFST